MNLKQQYASGMRIINRDEEWMIKKIEKNSLEKCLLYMALTRAQKGAFISGYGKMSEFIENKNQ